MSKTMGKAGGPATGETSEETQPKIKKKNKPKGTTTDQSGTATTVTKEKAPTTAPKAPPVPTQSYCFLCGDKSHTSKMCTKTGELRCENHSDTKSHETRACNIWH